MVSLGPMCLSTGQILQWDCLYWKVCGQDRGSDWGHPRNCARCGFCIDGHCMSIPGLLEPGLGSIGLAWAPMDRENSRGHVPTSFVPAQDWAVGDRTELKTGKMGTVLDWPSVCQSLSFPYKKEGRPFVLREEHCCCELDPWSSRDS